VQSAASSNISDAGAAPEVDATPDATPDVVESRAYSVNCPDGMREITGDFCTGLAHRCLKGTPKGPDPFYYCDEFEPGVAKCLGKKIPKHFCIDEFEYPNERGKIPRVMVTWWDAKKLCEVDGKRLCRDDEWTLACEGAEMLPYSYGWKRDKTACNIDHTWMKPNDTELFSKDPERMERELARISKRLPNGSMARCVSPYGVYDMTGNVDEWVDRIGGHPRAEPFVSTFKGGHWVGGARNRCRPETATHDPDFYWYAEGFRCCANASGADAGTASP
jgi:hypothetical protein